MSSEIRTNWTKEEIKSLYFQPLMELMYLAQTTLRKYHDPRKVQLCTLLNIKTGGCPEDCKYCSQSVKSNSGVKSEPLMKNEDILAKAKEAKDAGSTRFCMGAAWRQVRDGKDFERVLEVVREVRKLGLEPCVTLGMLTYEQALRLQEAGLHSYNHNLDTGENFYREIISTRTYADRLKTLENVRAAGIHVCCGGIIGMGETDDDRIDLLHTLATQETHPISVPINALIAIPGTPLTDQKRVSVWEMARMCATARILMPKAMVRLSGGRMTMSYEEQALLFLAGANSLHTGGKLLTTPIHQNEEDINMLALFGLEPKESSNDEHEMTSCLDSSKTSSCCSVSKQNSLPILNKMSH